MMLSTQRADISSGGRARILQTLRNQYRRLAEAAANERIVLWFDACLFDQARLAHIKFQSAADVPLDPVRGTFRTGP